MWVPPPPPPPKRTQKSSGGTKTATARSGVPPVPTETVTHDRAPLDRREHDEGNESTIFVSNIKYGATELEILMYFNSIGGTFENRKPNVVVACNFAYVQGTNQFDGKAFFMYSTIALAKYAVETLNDVDFKGRPLLDIFSRERLNVRSTRANSLLGSSRANNRIWDCVGETKREPDKERD